jgi:thiamine-monophosphate kinase
LGEFRLIDRLRVILDSYISQTIPGSSDRLLIGIGDDTAVWRNSDRLAITTTDAMVEGVHYRADTTSWYELGWKAMASNLSDVASMGGKPLYAVVILALRPEVQVAQVEEMYKGMAEIGVQYGTTVVGGDVVSSPTACMVGVTVFGESYSADSSLLLRRNAARSGDLVAVTGTVGGSGAGLAMILQNLVFPPDIAAALRRYHSRPLPRVNEGTRLVETGVKAAMDVSDGLVGDLQKMCIASGVAARLNEAEAPTPPEVRVAFPNRWVDYALYGGEDYELLFTAPPPVMAGAIAALGEDELAGASVIGEITDGQPGQVMLVDKDGKERLANRGGWDHFAS